MKKYNWKKQDPKEVFNLFLFLSFYIYYRYISARIFLYRHFLVHHISPIYENLKNTLYSSISSFNHYFIIYFSLKNQPSFIFQILNAFARYIWCCVLKQKQEEKVMIRKKRSIWYIKMLKNSYYEKGKTKQITLRKLGRTFRTDWTE